MPRRRERVPATLVSLSLLLSKSELAGLDLMASSLELDRLRTVLLALDFLALSGPGVATSISAEPGEALAAVRCGFCGASA